MIVEFESGSSAFASASSSSGSILLTRLILSGADLAATFLADAFALAFFLVEEALLLAGFFFADVLPAVFLLTDGLLLTTLSPFASTVELSADRVVALELLFADVLLLSGAELERLAVDDVAAAFFDEFPTDFVVAELFDGDGLSAVFSLFVAAVLALAFFFALRDPDVLFPDVLFPAGLFFAVLFFAVDRVALFSPDD